MLVDACLTLAEGHAERVAALHMIEPHADRPTAITLGAASSRSKHRVSLSSSSRIRPLKLSMKPFCIGFPGAMKCQLRDSMLANRGSRLCPRLMLLRHRDNLLFSEPCSLHLSVLLLAGL